MRRPPATALAPLLALSAFALLGVGAAFRVTPLPPASTQTGAPAQTPVPAQTQAEISYTDAGTLPVGAAIPSDPLYGLQWYLPRLQVPAAWGLLQSRGGQQPTKLQKVGQQATMWPALAAVTVAVLDTGYVSSPELGERAIRGYDFVSDIRRAGDGNGRDPDGSGVGQYAYHGEVTANVIAAAHDGQGMAGINPQAKVLHVRVADTEGMVALDDFVDGLRWAAGLPVAGVPRNLHPARILNVSLFVDFIPLTGCHPRVQAAVNEVTRAGALVVAGAGNSADEARRYSPAGCTQVLTVGSVNAQRQRSSYANWGSSVGLAAFGGDRQGGKMILSHSTLFASGINESEGTSMATPQVSGTASLLLAINPKLTPAQLRQTLLSTAQPWVQPCDLPPKTCGVGLLNVAAAVRGVLPPYQ